MLDCIAPLVTQTITFGYLFPIIGMPPSMIAPVYLGGMLALFMQLGFTLSMKTGFDLTYNRFIDYHITLPLPKRWLFGAYILNNMLEVALITFPLFGIGIFILKPQFNLAHTHWAGLFFTYLLVLAFFSTFYLTLAYTATLNWLLDNAWPRLLVPLWTMSSALVTWKKAFAWSPHIGYIMLLSPFTYVSEGLRSALLNNEDYIAWPLCCAIIILYIIVNLLILRFGIKKRLDPL